MYVLIQMWNARVVQDESLWLALRLPGLRIFCAGGLLAALLAFASGCATVRHAREIQAGTNSPPGERTLKATEVGLASNMVLSLDRALEIARANHPTIALASQNLAAATAQLKQVRAGYWPALDGSLGYSKGTANSEIERGNTDLDTRYSAGLDMDLLVYDFGKTPAQVRQAMASLMAATEELRAAQNNVSYNLRSAYYSLGKAQELRQVAEEAVRQFQAHLDQVRAFAEVGRRIRYDVTKAEVDLGNAELALIDARNEVMVARATLNRSLGLAEDPGFAIAGVPAPDADTNLDDLMARARQRHPELRALEARERAASAAVSEAIADLYPDLRLSAQLSFAGTAFPLVWNASAALRSAWRIFSAGRQTGRIEETLARLRAARALYATREQQVYLDLSKAVSQLQSARQRLVLTALIARQARESLELINGRYRVGNASAVEVTDAEVALTRARADEVKARCDCLIAVAQINNAIGEE